MGKDGCQTHASCALDSLLDGTSWYCTKLLQQQPKAAMAGSAVTRCDGDNVTNRKSSPP